MSGGRSRRGRGRGRGRRRPGQLLPLSPSNTNGAAAAPTVIGDVPSRTMATSTAPPPPAAKGGAKGDAERKQGNSLGAEGGGGGGEGQKRKWKEASIYGNYKHYYGYRIDPNVGEDPRLAIFKREWFEGKDCLDIGCNQGLVTIDLALKFECRSILGVDIDSGLIEDANWNLRRTFRLATEMSNGNISNHKHRDLCKIVSFRHENFVQSVNRCSEKYDAILCLSVTKWIHLNWGDEGMITLFVKIWRLLRPGGVFIMEPQPWNSYKKNRLVSETARENFSVIQIFPQKFREILLDKVGFRSVEVVTDKLVGAVIGFDRPIEVYHK